MKRDLTNELSPEVREKAKKNLVYVGIFSIVMMFAGFTSAYIVSMGDSFWLKYPMPNAFWMSTVVIVLSSIFLQLGIRFVKKNNQKMLKLFVALTLICGFLFIYFQFRGYAALVSEGSNFSNKILVAEGRYGDYYEIKYKDKFIETDGINYFTNNEKLSESQMSELKKFMKPFLKLKRNISFVIKEYGSPFILYYRSQPLGLINGKLCTPDGKEIQNVDQMRLQKLAEHIRDGRIDFFKKGEPGKEFHIYFKGKELQYKNRDLYFEGRKLSKYLQIKAMETADTATSYLYIITFLHLLHVAVTLLYMIKLTIASFSGKFNSNENLSLRLGGIFWHFLGLLWIYLLLFLLFIH